MRTPRRRPPILTVALGVLTVAAIAVAVAVVGAPSTSSARERTVTVRRGVVESTVSGSGNLAAKKEVNLDFASSGQVTHIYVHEGEKVVKGQLLATIDPSSAEVAVAQAQADLQSAQDTLSSVSSSSSSTTTASTGTAAAVAYVAQAKKPTTKKTSTPSSSSSSGSSGSGTKTSYAAALAAVESAELSVKSAQAELQGTKIIAPAAATVAEVNGSVGETAGSSAQGSTGSSSSFIVLAQLQRFKMDVSLTESDIGKVRVGQAATVTVNAASGAEFAAHVASVGVLPTTSSSSTSSSSAVSYPVTLVLDQSGAGLKPGMSASADIIISRASGIVVPTEALNGSTVTVVRNGKQISQQVQTGVAGDTTTQILAGLRVGDQVVIRAATVNATAGGTGTTGTGSRIGRFGGGGFGGGGFAVPSGGGGPPGGFPR